MASGETDRARGSSSGAQLGFTGKRFPGPRRLEPSLLAAPTLPGAGGDDRQLNDDEERDPPYLAIFLSATSSWYNADKIREPANPLRCWMRKNLVMFRSATSSLYGLEGGETTGRLFSCRYLSEAEIASSKSM